MSVKRELPVLSNGFVDEQPRLLMLAPLLPRLPPPPSILVSLRLPWAPPTPALTLRAAPAAQAAPSSSPPHGRGTKRAAKAEKHRGIDHARRQRMRDLHQRLFHALAVQETDVSGIQRTQEQLLQELCVKVERELVQVRDDNAQLQLELLKAKQDYAKLQAELVNARTALR